MIDDSGPGIREEDRAAMMEPFVRRDASRSRRTGAPGLASPWRAPSPKADGGTLRLEDAPHGDLRAVVSLPLFEIMPP